MSSMTHAVGATDDDAGATSDWSSVEASGRSSVAVFGGSGEAAITGLIFPDPARQGAQVFAEKGSVKLDQARVRHLDSTH
jgi:sucrose-6-phosphate hydrolase SacC (GH32 family)